MGREPEEGDRCRRCAENGVLAYRRSGSCSCHTCPPCNACTDAVLCCDQCGEEPFTMDPIEEQLVAGLRARGYQITKPDGEVLSPTPPPPPRPPAPDWARLRDFDVRNPRSGAGARKTLACSYVILEHHWRGSDAARRETLVRMQIADMLARELLKSGAIAFHKREDLHRQQTTVIGEVDVFISRDAPDDFNHPTKAFK